MIEMYCMPTSVTFWYHIVPSRILSLKNKGESPAALCWAAKYTFNQLKAGANLICTPQKFQKA